MFLQIHYSVCNLIPMRQVYFFHISHICDSQETWNQIALISNQAESMGGLGSVWFAQFDTRPLQHLLLLFTASAYFSRSALQKNMSIYFYYAPELFSLQFWVNDHILLCFCGSLNMCVNLSNAYPQASFAKSCRHTANYENSER